MSGRLITGVSQEAAQVFGQADAAGGELRVDAMVGRKHPSDRAVVIRELERHGLLRRETREVRRVRRPGMPLVSLRGPAETFDVLVVEDAYRGAVVLADRNLSHFAL